MLPHLTTTLPMRDSAALNKHWTNAREADFRCSNCCMLLQLLAGWLSIKKCCSCQHLGYTPATCHDLLLVSLALALPVHTVVPAAMPQTVPATRAQCRDTCRSAKLLCPHHLTAACSAKQAPCHSSTWRAKTCWSTVAAPRDNYMAVTTATEQPGVQTRH